MSRLSFQEKMLWARLAGVMVVVGFYLRYLGNSAPGNHYLHAVLIVLLFLFASVRTFVRWRSRNVIEDERDRAVAAIGTRWSNNILWAGLLVIFVLYWDHGSVQSASFLIGLLFHLLVLAALARIIREIVAYRMSA
jgi:uncharacterized membrane protein